MIKYQRNNIIFRIASSSAIAKFKTAQANSFLQLARKELNFDDGAKEVVLLEYDRFSQWMFRVERICLAAGEGFLTKPIQLAIADSFKDELRVVESVIESHPQVFSNEIITYTKLIHSYTLKIIYNFFDLGLTTTTDVAIDKIIETVSSYLQHLLIAMHEFNDNFINKTQPPFISISDFSLMHANSESSLNKFEPCLYRALYFVGQGLGETFLLKNYSSCNIFDAAHEYFSSFKLTLIPEMLEEEIPA